MFNLTSICPQHFITLICRSWSYNLHSVTDDVIVVMFVPHTIFCHKGVGADCKRGADRVDQKVETSFRNDRKVGKGQASGEDRKVKCVCVGGGQTFKTDKQTKRVIILLQNKPSALFLLVPRLNIQIIQRAKKQFCPHQENWGGAFAPALTPLPHAISPCSPLVCLSSFLSW